jgi:flagellar basal body-associated protein FliL
MGMDKRILAGGAVLLGAAGWFYVKPNYIDVKPAPVYTEAEIASAPRPTVQLEERVINLKAPASSPNYVKAAIAIEFADPEHAYIGLSGHALVAKNEEFHAHLEPDLPKIWDIITNVVGGKSVDQVSTSEGRDELKQELVARFNEDLHGEHQVENIYLVTFITQ